MPFLLDTCVWIDVERGVLAPGDVAALTGEDTVYLSPVTLAELRLGAEIAVSEDLRQRRLAALTRIQRQPVLPMDGVTGMVFGAVAAAVRQAGRQHRSRIQDLWLASQAIQHHCRLLTRNPHDFEHIPALDIAVYRLA
ncbi:MAG TPA: type II toxin-antitoxin system VapC family toxin [Terriglobales bacterium]|nr:type II toxin-antitoxin system VapC family toxin [Terriglobales bacterium]